MKILSFNFLADSRQRPPAGEAIAPAVTPKKEAAMTKEKAPRKPNSNQREMIRRRGLDPANYLVIKDTYTSLYLRDVRNGMVKIIAKYM